MGCGVALEKTRAVYSAHSWSYDDNLCPQQRLPTQCLVMVPASTGTAGLSSPHLHGGTKKPAWGPIQLPPMEALVLQPPQPATCPGLGTDTHGCLADPCACSGWHNPSYPSTAALD